jgi:uncharacterized protein with PIN domain
MACLDAHLYSYEIEYNLSFHKPKSDRCPVCEKERVAVKENIQIQESERRYYEKHEKYDSNTFVS